MLTWRGTQISKVSFELPLNLYQIRHILIKPTRLSQTSIWKQVYVTFNFRVDVVCLISFELASTIEFLIYWIINDVINVNNASDESKTKLYNSIRFITYVYKSSILSLHAKREHNKLNLPGIWHTILALETRRLYFEIRFLWGNVSYLSFELQLKNVH